ncbi:MAG: hypothetical protein WC510_00945 [Candidatus Omnitrophota bacterium]
MNIFEKIRLFILYNIYIGLPSQTSITIGAPLKEKFNEEFAQAYFKLRGVERSGFIADIGDYFKLDEVNFCSIGCGFGGEEYLLDGKVKTLVLVEPDFATYQFLKRKFESRKTIIQNNTFQNYKPQIKFDIIYTSSLSPWMSKSPFSGIPGDLLEFIDAGLEKEGVFIARIYGAAHFAVTASLFYVKTLLSCLDKEGFKILLYIAKEKKESFLAVCRKSSLRRAEDMSFFGSEQGITIVRDGQIVRKAGVPFFQKIKRLLCLFLYLWVMLFQEARNIWYLIRINIKLILE